MTHDVWTVIALCGLFAAFLSVSLSVHLGTATRRFFAGVLIVVAVGALLVLFRPQIPPHDRPLVFGATAAVCVFLLLFSFVPPPR